MGELGVCADYHTDPEAIAASGASWVSVVLTDHRWEDFDSRAHFFPWCKDLGLKVLGRFARESCYQWVNDGDGYLTELYPDDAADFWIAELGDTIDAFQIGNEPDIESPSSWTMEPGRLNALLRYFRNHWGGHQVCAGMASGDPSYMTQVDRKLYDVVAIHPYTQTSDTMPTLMAGYAPYLDGKELWFTEFEDLALIPTLTDLAAVSFKFSWQDWADGHGNVWHGGLHDTEGHPKSAYHLFKMYADDINSREKETPLPEFVLGFADYAAAHPEVGEPLTSEFTLADYPGFGRTEVIRVQYTDKGLLHYFTESNRVIFKPFV